MYSQFCFHWYLHDSTTSGSGSQTIVYISSGRVKMYVHYGSKPILHLQPLSGHTSVFLLS